MAALDIDYKPWRTLVIPVERNGDNYTINVVKEVWNDLQVLILNGAKTDRLTIEFQIKQN